MTFLNTRYRLLRNLTSKEFEKLGRLATEYGIRGLTVEGGDLAVEYDASRIHEAEVLAAVRRVGIPVEPREPIPAGGFDYTGEFKDFTWPTQGVSAVNQKNNK